MTRTSRPRRMLRSAVGVVLPSVVLLAGCPQQCAPTAAPTQPAAQLPAAAPPPAAGIPAPHVAPAPPSPPVTTRPPTTVPSQRPPDGVEFAEDFSSLAAFSS